MSTLTHDKRLVAAPAVAPSSHLGSGLVLAVVSAVSFGLAGALARGLLDTGWTPGAITLARVGIAAAVLTPFAVAALRGSWGQLVRNLALVTTYGTVAIAGAQFCYFSAIQHMQVGPALLIEYTAPAAVVVFLWLRHGQRPGVMTVAGAAVSALGLLLVLDLFSGADISGIGVLWALGAMVGCATHFLIGARQDTGLPPLALGWAGLLVGTLELGGLGLAGVLPMRATTEVTSYAGAGLAWWMPLVLLGLVTAALAYVTGIAAGRLLGSRLASFVGLLEVVAGVLWAWILLAQLPGVTQLAGGLLILAGVVGVKLGERSVVSAAD